MPARLDLGLGAKQQFAAWRGGIRLSSEGPFDVVGLGGSQGGKRQ